MSRIRQIDPRMAIHRIPENPDREWRSVREEPFSLHGLYRPQDPGQFLRMPADVAAATSEGVAELNKHTSGGRIRFVTDSPFVSLRAALDHPTPMDHMTDCGIFGFDLYVKKDGMPIFRGTFRPPTDVKDGYESELTLPDDGPWEVMIHFPLYCGVIEVELGLKKGCLLAAPEPYPNELPVVFYGSSITQGGCASRPGNCYSSILSRMFDFDFVNLGFSGSAKGEDAMIDYLANLPMRAFVCDYDHNAPNPDHLAQTHEKLVRAVRAKNPLLPILLVSKPDVLWNEADAAARRAIIRKTYENALRDGNGHIAFVDGATLFDGPMRDSCTVDGCHPNDLGMMRMAETLGAELKKWL